MSHNSDNSSLIDEHADGIRNGLGSASTSSDDILTRYKRLSPVEWSFDDVAAWMIGVARKHQVPLEEINFDRFSGYTGAHLALMTRQNFDDKEPSYGALLYAEFRTHMGVLLKAEKPLHNLFPGDDNGLIDEWMRELIRTEEQQRARNSNTAATLALLNAAQQGIMLSKLST